MEEDIEGLPGWSFDINEVSMGVYKVTGTRQLGGKIELSGIDPDDLMRRARAWAEKTEKDLQK
jgi:hypothetical protein